MRLCQLLRKCCGSSILPYEFLSPAQRWASTGKNVAHSVRLKTQTTGKMKHPMKQPTVSRDGQVLEKMYLSTVSVFPNKPSTSISISIKKPSITCKYFKYFSETPSFNIRQLLSILLLKGARRGRVINELQISTKESYSF